MMYKVFLYHEFGEPHFKSEEISVRNRSEAVTAARLLKLALGDRSDFFTVVDENGMEIYHSILGAWDDQRIP